MNLCSILCPVLSSPEVLLLVLYMWKNGHVNKYFGLCFVNPQVANKKLNNYLPLERSLNTFFCYSELRQINTNDYLQLDIGLSWIRQLFQCQTLCKNLYLLLL